MRSNSYNWKRFLFEFLSIFIAVSLAFALNKWNENRKDHQSETKILTEIKNGLERDLGDIQENISGHREGIRACNYFRDLIANKPVASDSTHRKYFILFRDFISIQNSWGYESLKSQGLELIQNDSLRYNIISLYDFHYEIIQKLEESYSEMQFNQTYFNKFNDVMAEYMTFDATGKLQSFKQPINLSAQDRKRLLSYLWRIEDNRRYTVRLYLEVEQIVTDLIKTIETELK